MDELIFVDFSLSPYNHATTTLRIPELFLFIQIWTVIPQMITKHL